jgi:spermidine synthase
MERPLRGFVPLLLLAAFVVATCGLIYELVAGTLASYLLGDSVTQFSTIIGTYLFSMGIGSYLSKYFKGNLIAWFIRIEILVGLVGGFSSTLLYVLFEQLPYFRFILYLLVSITGILVGLEIPLLMRILKDRLEFNDLVSKVFTVDYIGALLASIIFPILLIPYLGILRTSLLFGILNVLVGGYLCFYFKQELVRTVFLKGYALLSLMILLTGFILADHIIRFAEVQAYQDTILFARSSPYQRIILTKSNTDIRLYLNGNLQFSSLDEYRYHESLVHPGLAALPNAKRVLILGGGDGLALREVLKHPTIETVTLVDLDAAITKLFKSNEILLKLNGQSLLSRKVKVINQDAFTWIKDTNQQFDFVIIDFPDPSNYSIGKLYTQTFYRQLAKVIAPDGCAVVQSTSPYVARKSFWIINATIESAGFMTKPYHCYLPSFGEWGFVLLSKNKFQPAEKYPAQLRFINADVFAQLCHFPPDMQQVQSQVNFLHNQALVNTFEKEWQEYTR